MSTSEPPERKREALCPCCLTPNDPVAHFCVRCRTPLDAFATIDPMASIAAEGDTFIKATRKPTGMLTLVGMWAIFGPTALGSLLGLCLGGYELISGFSLYGGPFHGGATIVAMLTSAAFLTLCGFILFRVTGNFLMQRRMPPSPDPEDQEQDEDEDPPADQAPSSS